MTVTPAMVDAALDSWCAPGWRNMPENAAYERADMSAALTAALAVSGYGEVVEALKSVRSLISEAAATGFNYKDGDWPERLYFSQQRTSTALSRITGDQS
jgi:hypothetical protein